MTPEILIVGDPAGRRQLADQIAANGYGVALCSPRELNRRVRTSSPPAAIVACISDLDADVLLAGLRRTRAGASIPVILYGRLGGNLRDLADVLDIGADHFVEEPADEVELRHALAQFVRPSGAARGPVSRGRDYEDERGPRHDGRARGPRRDSQAGDPRSDRDPRGEPGPGDERRDERDGPRRRKRPRGAALGELHRTLDRLEESLRSDDSRSDPELAQMGLDGIPDVDPPGDESSDPLITEIGEHIRGRSGSYEPVRGDGLRPLARARRDPLDRAPERDRPRSRTVEMGRSRRPPDPDHDTGPGRRSWRDSPSEETGSGRGSSSSSRTRAWDRAEHEGPLRRGRERPDEGRSSSRSSAVLLGRRPGRDAGRESARPEREPPRSGREPSESTGRFDPHARDTLWPVDDFDPSESTMIRRERSSATTRRRSLGGWTGDGSPGDSPRARGDRGRGSDAGRSMARGRAPSREPTQSLEPEPKPKPEPKPELSEAPPRSDEPEPAKTPRARRAGRSIAPTRPSAPSLRIDPSLRESGKLSADTDVATILWALHEQRFTGKLRLNRQRIEKQVWLHDGEAVFARSTATRDRLVDGLLRRGVLTRPQYETARRLAAKEPRRAGQLLVDAGFLKSRELDVLLRDHLARVIDATFVWSEGSWTSEPGERTDEPIQLEVPMAALVLDGVRYRCDASELEDRLTRRVGGRGPLVPRLRAGTDELGEDRRAAVDAVIDELGERFRLLPEEESWLRRFDGRHGVAALLADGADEQALFALLFTLDLAGYVDLREEAQPPALGDRDPSQVDSERILERLRLAREADYFELLGVTRDASRSEIRQAHTELSSTFEDEALEDESRRRHVRELRELRAAIEEARDILADDAMRSAYLAHLGDPSQV
ncbi:DUF4388 domain-containing protein [Enhygromyxa salina]|uniref:DUF4388 domain-containing protein n=1 Tax=Enhygromyxa salina TaxID=215803 RepID=UPI000D0917B8|nr:DUF4388 domain-containing protein [Enhygromyxa salina]